MHLYRKSTGRRPLAVSGGVRVNSRAWRARGGNGRKTIDACAQTSLHHDHYHGRLPPLNSPHLNIPGCLIAGRESSCRLASGVLQLLFGNSSGCFSPSSLWRDGWRSERWSDVVPGHARSEEDDDRGRCWNASTARSLTGKQRRAGHERQAAAGPVLYARSTRD